jgi:agmatine/peptidylarginine deiminase
MGAMEVVKLFDEMADFRKIGSPFSIPKAALVLAGFQPGYSINEYASLEEQLKSFTNLKGQSFNLYKLPFPSAIYDEDGERLPATYANFLIMKNTVLMPSYNQPENDALAIERLQRAFPGYKIVAVDCNALIKQHGSLHCVTMQLPQEILSV